MNRNEKLILISFGFVFAVALAAHLRIDFIDNNCSRLVTVQTIENAYTQVCAP